MSEKKFAADLARVLAVFAHQGRPITVADLARPSPRKPPARERRPRKTARKD
ncbi:hypothetical protein [Limnoglobus roseus]|uniref:Transcriptional regulator n=1 Tax=Limnoglobus roseus TaxID=2598579 RepID=A0A5C1ACN3_9BACT|nr:hypothetical protein [Limnoglobus roseus]QEL15897.1 hypothetical protein PX52LOC_02833 [Limnoglobus roseus]